MARSAQPRAARKGSGAVRRVKRRPRSGRRLFSVGLPRERLVEIFKELEASLEPRLSWRTSIDLRLVLYKILDQERDTRVNLLPWQIAMLAAALVDKRNAQPKAAIIAAIEFYAPERAADDKFRSYIERTYSRVRAGKNAARGQLLPVPDEVVEMAWSRHINAHVAVKGQAK